MKSQYTARLFFGRFPKEFNDFTLCRTVIKMTKGRGVLFSSVVYCIKHVRLVGVLTS